MQVFKIENSQKWTVLDRRFGTDLVLTTDRNSEKVKKLLDEAAEALRQNNDLAAQRAWAWICQKKVILVDYTRRPLTTVEKIHGVVQINLDRLPSFMDEARKELD